MFLFGITVLGWYETWNTDGSAWSWSQGGFGGRGLSRGAEEHHERKGEEALEDKHEEVDEVPLVDVSVQVRQPKQGGRR